MVIAITGANRFLGDGLLRKLSQCEVVALVSKELSRGYFKCQAFNAIRS
jgi:dTDP-4-dehydrorhamnose reductase